MVMISAIRTKTRHGSAGRQTDDAEFRNGRGQDALGPELIEQTLGHAIRPTKPTYFLAETKDISVSVHFFS